MKHLLHPALLLGLAVPGAAGGANLDIEVQNLTAGTYFAPLLISAHSPDLHLFQTGEAASAEIQAMAEGGDLAGLVTLTSGNGADNSENPAAGPLAPGMSVSTSLTTEEGNAVLSITGMMVPSNDGFVGLDGWMIPTAAGSYVVYLNGYDAGTEANDEVRGGGAPGTPGLPVLPFFQDEIGQNGTGVTDAESNSMIHVHPGHLGDALADGGGSDLDNRLHRWLNPVAKLTLTVN
ncbi:spondin domain-containing protein [Bowmanella dokdonensis]|uniref:Spondin domain-containing protein n=1 Tax=Bowmanella dokdonensis TaxID=751969 RepID=A0A939DPE6_9ALTE|nr:spondin domain-containing protein [Bowmanella dokdonensis]MBN7825942.1 spondin domain-containing protein [Bowmanella dokdonensis]